MIRSLRPPLFALPLTIRTVAAIHLVAAILVVAALTACVTESATPTRGTPVKGSSAARAALPDGPLATPAAQARTTISKVQVAVLPIGFVEYDGLTLPLVSPDGRFLVSRIGTAPEWPAMLAAAGAAAPPPGSFRIFGIGDKALEPIDSSAANTEDCVLGRDCDSQGFLVERMNADGSRSIGKVPWISAGDEVRWLVESTHVNAHAVLFGGGLLFVRREIDSASWSLVYWSDAGAEVVRAATGGTYTMPLQTNDAGLVWALRTTAAGTELEAIRFADGAFGRTLSRTLLTASTTPAASFQLSASTSNGSVLDAKSGPPLAILSTRENGVVAINLDSGRATLICKGAIAVTPVSTSGMRGYICTKDEGLVYVPEDAATQPSTGRAMARTDARLLNSPYIVRATSAEAAPFILLGPALNAPDRMEVLKMAIAPDASGR